MTFGMTPEEIAHQQELARRMDEAANTAACKYCGGTIIWRKRTYDAFGHFNVIATNADGNDHDRNCQGEVRTYKLESL